MSNLDPVKIVLNIHCSRLSGEPFIGLNIELNQGITVKELIVLYNVDFSQIGLIVVNNRQESDDYQLLDGDTLSIYPLFEGG